MGDIEGIISASEPNAWERYRKRLYPSYMTKVTRDTFQAGFDAGLAFARIAATVTRDSDDENSASA